MTVHLQCECGFEIDVPNATSVGEFRCPRCGRRIYADEESANADFDQTAHAPKPSGVHHEDFQAATTLPLVPRPSPEDDPDVTLEISQGSNDVRLNSAERDDNEFNVAKPNEAENDEELLNHPTKAISTDGEAATQVLSPTLAPDKPKPAAPTGLEDGFDIAPPSPQRVKPEKQNSLAKMFQDIALEGNPLAAAVPPKRGSDTGPSKRGSRIDLAERVMRPINKMAVPSGAGPQHGAYGIHRVVRVHQKGGMGRILVAYDQHLKREVALKELHPEVSDDDSIVRRFVGEAEITAQLEHPGVVPVHYLGQDQEGLPYYTMKMIHGETLQEAIKAYHKKPERQSLLRLIRHLVSASKTIAFAHSKGVIHRDLKPANIMIGEYGETLVMDWGLAKPFSQSDQESSISYVYRTNMPRPDLTMVGAIVGTPAFMAPEQAAADDAMIGPLSDVFALGTVLYYLLAGQTAFSGRSTQEVLNKVRAANPSRPSIHKPNVPHGLEAICLKAMAKLPENRYQGANEFVDDLCRWLDNEPVSAEKETTFQHIARWFVKHKAIAIRVPIALVLAVVLIFAGIEYAYYNGASEEHKTLNTVLNEQVDLIDHTDSIAVACSVGANVRREARPAGGWLLTCQIDMNSASPQRVIILHAPFGHAWDISSRKALAFSLFESHVEHEDTLRNFDVRLGCGSSYYSYTPSADFWKNRHRSNWFPFSVSLTGSTDDWSSTTVGVPSPKNIEWIEFHFDVNAPMTIHLDKVMLVKDDKLP